MALRSGDAVNYRYGWLGASALGAVRLSLFCITPSMAQQSNADTGAGHALPAVTVDAPKSRHAASGAAQSRPRHVARSAAKPRPTPPRATTVVEENPRGAIRGYVAGRSMVGTKTNTPINETPQSITVVGSEQIRDQKPVKFDEILRYAAGVSPGTFGADTRNDWFLIRGFKSDDNSMFLDGLQLFYTAYASWKLQPFDLERVEVLRGPSAVLYGGSSPSGLVNAVSKMPPSEPIHTIETGVNNFGNAYLGFDFGGPVAASSETGKLFYRLVGQVQNGGTQVDFTPDNNYFIAPSVTWKPDADTSFTVLASASFNQTRGINFLPYVGTVTAAPFGRIPTGLFVGDPSVDNFKREQEMLGYQFERNLSDDFTFRQNARFAHVDVTYSGLIGNGYTNQTTGDIARYNFLARDIANQADLDNQLEYRFDTGLLQHKALFGLDLKHYDISDYQGFSFGTPSINALNPVYTQIAAFSGTPYQNAELNQNQLGAYLQDQIKLGRFTLVLSGRNDWVSLTDDSRLPGALALGRDDSKFSGRSGLIYNFDSGMAPYVSYATSYNPIVGLNSSGALLLPETGEQSEIGVKYQPNGFDGHFSAAWFNLKRENVLTSDPNSVPPNLQTQDGQVTSRGVELEAVANLAPGLKVVSSFTSYNIFVSKDDNPALVGTVPTNTPSQLASGWGDYTFQSGALAGFGFGGGVRYVGSSFADTANTMLVPSRVLGDAAVHYEWQNWRLAVNVANIADKIYVASCSTANACFYGDRRRITGSIAYKW